MWTVRERGIYDIYLVKHQIVQGEEKIYKGENAQGKEKKAQKTE